MTSNQTNQTNITTDSVNSNNREIINLQIYEIQRLKLDGDLFNKVDMVNGTTDTYFKISVDVLGYPS